MPILVVADLHLDMWLQAGRDPLAALSPELLGSLDGVFIAGDLSNKPKVRWQSMIRHLARYVPLEHIHVLPGNHDYYDHVLDGDDRLAEICAEAGANFAQKSVTVIGDTRFLSCTLWTDFALHADPGRAMMAAQRDMNDYRYIRCAGAGFRRIRPSDTAFIHADHRAWLEEKLSAPLAGETIVVTHHCPHPDLIGERRGDLEAAYGSNLLPMIEKFQPDLWLFGHTHWRVEATVGKTVVRNVSLAYPGQVPAGEEEGIFLRGLVSAITS
ncbi:metallophosphoesterase [Pseudotabrizicola formosa]|uniref:metallophosphoesterase n=1 Tax=Pseudotabrizicola formosa TaxID=2030009 RepID=UPI000CD29D97|nr:metallophosphoesterase [Pseudotabrizicola formosa]